MVLASMWGVQGIGELKLSRDEALFISWVTPHFDQGECGRICKENSLWQSFCVGYSLFKCLTLFRSCVLINAINIQCMVCPRIFPAAVHRCVQGNESDPWLAGGRGGSKVAVEAVRAAEGSARKRKWEVTWAAAD